MSRNIFSRMHRFESEENFTQGEMTKKNCRNIAPKVHGVLSSRAISF